MNNALSVSELKKSYRDAGNQTIPVLKGVTFTVKAGEVVAIIGSSGSGKSTLLHSLGGLDSYDSGRIEIAGIDIGDKNEIIRGKLRNSHLGFVYQFHHLQPEFSALENVAMPLLIRREAAAAAYVAAKAALQSVGLDHRAEHLPSQLSGGERQRVAIARAIVTKPDCILADEPTGNLDADTAQSVFDVFVNLARQANTAIVIVTHDKNIASQCDRILHLVDGVIV